MQNIVFIHGANMSKLSFNYIGQKLNQHNAVFPEYHTQNGLENNIQEACDFIKESLGNKSFTVIGHSMGGMVGLGVARKMPKCKKLITMSTPFGGSKLANFMSMVMPYHQMFRDIRTSDPHLQNLIDEPTPVPSLCLVSTVGNSPFNMRENDGVVSIESQKELKGAQIIELPVNHYEILMFDSAICEIRKFL